jgi:hypothetical protein
MDERGAIMAIELALEFETYQRNLPDLLSQQGRFVLIHRTRVIGTYGTHEEALRHGYEHIGLHEAFFVKKIQEVEQAQIFTRSIRPCPP